MRLVTLVQFDLGAGFLHLYETGHLDAIGHGTGVPHLDEVGHHGAVVHGEGVPHLDELAHHGVIEAHSCWGYTP